jgi:antiviral helicase SKI2
MKLYERIDHLFGMSSKRTRDDDDRELFSSQEKLWNQIAMKVSRQKQKGGKGKKHEKKIQEMYAGLNFNEISSEEEGDDDESKGEGSPARRAEQVELEPIDSGPKPSSEEKVLIEEGEHKIDEEVEKKFKIIMVETEKLKKREENRQGNYQWAVWDLTDLSDFYVVLPKERFAMQYPFELDVFQKRAVLHLEKSEVHQIC